MIEYVFPWVVCLVAQIAVIILWASPRPATGTTVREFVLATVGVVGPVIALVTAVGWPAPFPPWRDKVVVEHWIAKNGRIFLWTLEGDEAVPRAWWLPTDSELYAGLVDSSSGKKAGGTGKIVVERVARATDPDGTNAVKSEEEIWKVYPEPWRGSPPKVPLPPK